MKEHFVGFEMIHIANIASLIMDQATCIELPITSFNERLNEANEESRQTIAELVPSEDAREQILEALLSNSSAYRDVYFEAGILCGVKLARALSADTDAYRELMSRHSEKADQNNA